MNRAEHILTILGEEGVEVAKEVSKALRFGLDDKLTLDPFGERGTEGPTNRDKIRDEFIDMLGVYQKGVEEGLLPDVGLIQLPASVRVRMALKGQRIEDYMHYAKRVGALQLDTVDPPARKGKKELTAEERWLMHQMALNRKLGLPPEKDT